MKTPLLLLSLLALLLVSCGKTNKKQNTLSNNNSTIVSTTPNEEPMVWEGEKNNDEIDHADCISLDDPQDQDDFGFKLCKTVFAEGTCKNRHYSYTYDEDEGFWGQNDLYSFPLNDHGWIAVYSSVEASEGSPGYYHFSVYRIDNGMVCRIENDLPVPDIDAFLDAEKCQDHQADVAKLTKLYNARPRDFINYEFGEDLEMELELRPLDLENEQYHNRWKESFWELRKLNGPVYCWDGQNFIPKPECDMQAKHE